MVHINDVAETEIPPAALIEELASDTGRVGRPDLLARLHDLATRSRAAFKKQSEDFEALYKEATQNNPDPAALTELAELLCEKGRARAERLRPQMAALEDKLARHGHKLDPQSRECFQQLLGVAAGSLALYETLHDRLLALSEDRKPGLDTILRARPISGDIDHQALSREFIARYPKIRAALAR